MAIWMKGPVMGRLVLVLLTRVLVELLEVSEFEI